MAITWEGILLNKWELHIDGVSHGQNGNPVSREVISGGDILIGKNPFQAGIAVESYVGQITSFNIWNYKWSSSAIASLAENCETQPGNVFQWHSAKDNLHGEVKLLQPLSCM